MFYFIIAILLFSIYGSGQLSLYDWKKKNVCPKILGIPACYIVFTLFGIGLFFHSISISNYDSIIYVIAIGFIFLIASIGTITELRGIEICPRTKKGTPMCYFSLALASILIILKFIQI